MNHLAAIAVVLGLAAAPAGARCVTADDLATGVSFKRQDGRSGLAKQKGGEVDINYATAPKSEWEDHRRGEFGIYENYWFSYPSEELVIGQGPGGTFDYKLQGKPPVPVAGQSWASQVAVTVSTNNGSENGDSEQKFTLDVTYRFLETKQVKLSGCTYTILPVEATFTGEGADFTRRWLYFPDLGFGLETRLTDRNTNVDDKMGLTALTPKG